MSQAAGLNFETNPPLAGVASPAGSRDEFYLREALKHCPPATCEAVHQFRLTNRLDYLPGIVQGVITHYVEPSLRGRLTEPGDNLQLNRDLGLDSLTMMEIAIRLEDMLGVLISDQELRHIQTLGDVRRLIERAGAGRGPVVASPSSASVAS